MTCITPAVRQVLQSAGLADLEGDFVVLRRDYSDVVYLVAKGLSEVAAGFLVRHFIGLGHHQFYWAEVPGFDVRALEPSDIVPSPRPVPTDVPSRDRTP